MRKLLFIISILLIVLHVKAQSTNNFYLEMKLKGYIFLTHNGLFFQPLDRNAKKDFISSLDARSFKIFENHETVWSYVIKGVGDTIIAKKYFQDSLDLRNLTRNRDTIFYFKAEIQIQMVLDVNRTKVNDIGYGFIYRNNVIDYGNFITDNYLYSILPDEKKSLRQLYHSYAKSNYLIPSWLKTPYAASVRGSRKGRE